MLGPSAYRGGAVSLFGDAPMDNGGSGAAFATLTHARLRAGQGDVAGALRILRVILDVQPEHDEARRMLAELQDRVEVVHREPDEAPPDTVRPASVRELAGRFREAIRTDPPRSAPERLDAWLKRAQRNRGERRVQ